MKNLIKLENILNYKDFKEKGKTNDFTPYIWKVGDCVTVSHHIDDKYAGMQGCITTPTDLNEDNKNMYLITFEDGKSKYYEKGYLSKV